MDQWQVREAAAAELGKGKLLTKPNGAPLDVENGYIPLLINLTFEDKAAKGLRKRRPGDKREAAVYFTALEAVQDNRTLLLTGPSGAGKTTLAKHICFSFATGSAYKSKPVIRNEDGEVHEEIWDGSTIVPYLVTIESLKDLHRFTEELPHSLQAWSERGPARENQEIIYVLDSIEASGVGGLGLLSSVVDMIRASYGARLLVLGRQEELHNWILPSGLVRQQLLPLLQSQRLQSISGFQDGLSPSLSSLGSGSAAALPAIFAMSLSCNSEGETNEGVLDTWIEAYIKSAGGLEELLMNAHDAFYGRYNGALSSVVQQPFMSSRVFRDLLVAKHLASKPDAALQVLGHDSVTAQPIVKSLLHRISNHPTRKSLIDSMLHAESGLTSLRVALLAADFVDVQENTQVVSARSKLLEILMKGSLSVPERVMAGRILSRLGDPRDLEALAVIPKGRSTHGSASHPNSAPPYELELDEFRIGIFPVVNANYLKFIQETGRAWVSPDGNDAETQNAPATDVTCGESLGKLGQEMWSSFQQNPNGSGHVEGTKLRHAQQRSFTLGGPYGQRMHPIAKI
ncbi:unnamed protein product [Clonostachys byssicola]|uniref:Novel STAND NTPase 3 domain-containing protein n=1 Tax=Clonostachys byssicola TaxID=160290 RepID=A0A9N9UBB0_9HYPO|nr:unnamed protein product [Clonostachys byssicola]